MTQVSPKNRCFLMAALNFKPEVIEYMKDRYENSTDYRNTIAQKAKKKFNLESCKYEHIQMLALHFNWKKYDLKEKRRQEEFGHLVAQI